MTVLLMQILLKGETQEKIQIKSFLNKQYQIKCICSRAEAGKESLLGFFHSWLLKTDFIISICKGLYELGDKNKQTNI